MEATTKSAGLKKVIQNDFCAWCKVLDAFKETNIEDPRKMARGIPAPNPNSKLWSQPLSVPKLK